MIDKNIKIVALVGPTASGKTALAIELGEKFGGEIICADSRTIFRGLDIGTAKPSAADRSRVAHHLLDIAEPDELLGAAEFKRLAERALDEISGRGKVPFLVGGSGLYVYSVLYDYRFPAGPRTEERAALEQQPLPQLAERLKVIDPERACEIDLKNKRRVIRALETVGQPRQRRDQLPENCLLLGLLPEEQALYTRIVRRTNAMFQMGLVHEVEQLVGKYGDGLGVLNSPGYAEVVRMLRGELSQSETEDLIVLHTRQLAKRQMTWFKRNSEILWLNNPQQAGELVRPFLGIKDV